MGRDVVPGVVIGKELARTLRVFLGDEIDIVSPFGELGPAGPMPKSRRFRVAGIFYSGMYEYDMKNVYVLLEAGQSFLSTGDAITGIEIKVDDVERARAVADEIRAAMTLGGVRVRDWQELNSGLFGALALEKLAMFVTLGIAILIAGFCVFGTLTLMVQEKGREIGILFAMGTSKSSVVVIFLIEGILIGVYGASIGLGLGFLVTFVFEHFGIRVNPEVYYIDRLPVNVDGTEFALVGLIALGVCALATLFPAVLAGRFRPLDAIRHQ
jgi:lipoprotein-releasing system permease protein